MEERKYELETYIDNSGNQWYKISTERSSMFGYKKSRHYIKCVYEIAGEIIVSENFINNRELVDEILEMLSKIPQDEKGVTVGFSIDSNLKPIPYYFYLVRMKSEGYSHWKQHRSCFDGEVIEYITVKKYGKDK